MLLFIALVKKQEGIFKYIFKKNQKLIKTKGKLVSLDI